MQKILFYPYNENCDWIFDIQNEGIFNSVVAIKLTGDIRGNNHYKEKIKDEDQFEKEIMDTTIFLIVQTDINVDFDKYILPKIKYAIRNHKKILCTRTFNENEKKLLNKIIPEELCIGNGFILENLIQPRNTIYDIDVPVISVMGISKKLNSIKQLVKLRKKFEDANYKAILFSDSPEILLVKDGHFLSMLSENRMSNKNRMLQLNHFIKDIEVHENPDVIIMGITNGATFLGKDIIEDFGIDIYSVSHVVKPDCVIMNIFYGEYQPEMIEEIGENLSEIVGEKIDFYNITNQIMDNKDSETLGKVCTLEVDYQKVESVIKNLSQKNIYKLQGEDEYSKLVGAIIEKLSEYGEIVSI